MGITVTWDSNNITGEDWNPYQENGMRTETGIGIMGLE